MRIEEVRAGELGVSIAAGLREQREQIVEAIMARIYAVSEQAEDESEYKVGLTSSVSAAIEYALEVLEAGDDRVLEVPPALIAQVRLAARSRVTLQALLRQYIAGYTVLIDFVLEQSGRTAKDSGATMRLVRFQSTRFDRLLALLSDEYNREAEHRSTPSHLRHAKQVQKLLNGERYDATALSYDLKGHHLALVGIGADAEEGMLTVSSALDRQLLCTRHSGGATWGWLGGRRPFADADLASLATWGWPSQTTFATGEPAMGVTGWRLTHRQARAASTVGIRSGEAFTRYRDVALLAAIHRDDLLTASLRQMYLRPLAESRDSGEAYRTTLRAYFKSDRNVSATAALLSVSRQTVTSRLQAVEERIQRSLAACVPELDMALRISELTVQTDCKAG